MVICDNQQVPVFLTDDNAGTCSLALIVLLLPEKFPELVTYLLVIETMDGMTLDATVDKSSFPDAVPFAEVFVVLVVASCVPPLPMPIAENHTGLPAW